MKLFKSTYDKSYFSSICTVLTPPIIRKKELLNKKKLIVTYKKSGSILDIGCGEGLLLETVKDNFEIHGIDISEYAVAITNKKLGRNVATCLNIEKNTIHGKYDVITAFDVLEHLHNPSDTIRKILDALRPEGVFIFTVPNNYGIYGTLNTKFANLIDRTHISTFKRNEWIRIIRSLNVNYTVTDQLWFTFKESPHAKHFSVNLTVVVTK
jgi:2-polyprenyl-3-methyl-5-hydroxy-6-metoxy-1,4-benzoquinol methylase